MKKRKKLDGIVLGVLFYWISFVTVAWMAYFLTGGIPDTLVQVGLGGGAVELLATAAIEILTNRRKADEDICGGGADLHLGGDNGADRRID